MTPPPTAMIAAPTVFVNGAEEQVRSFAPNLLLGHYLRDELGRTDVKLACLEGACGACTVLVDDAPVLSCLTLVGRVLNRSVTTAAGLTDDRVGGAVANALVEHGGLQCGFCTPGWVCAAVALIRRRGADPLTREDISAALSGHLCRCTGYRTIIDSVVDAAQQIAGERPDESAGGRTDTPALPETPEP